MYVKVIIFISTQLLTILEKEYLSTYWALKNGSPLIFNLMDMEKGLMHFQFHFPHLFPKILMLNI